MLSIENNVLVVIKKQVVVNHKVLAHKLIMLNESFVPLDLGIISTQPDIVLVTPAKKLATLVIELVAFNIIINSVSNIDLLDFLIRQIISIHKVQLIIIDISCL